jgi:hypothetical protein
VAHITSDEDVSLVPTELYKDYPPEPFPDDFEWPDDFPEDPTLDDDELPPPEKFDESELPDDVPNRSEYDFPEDADFGDDLPDDARMWFIRPVEPEKNIYRIVNAHDPSRSLTGNNPLLQTDSSGDTTEIERVDSISYIQIREPGSEEFDASLSSRAQEYVEDDSKDAFTLTAVDVPQESADPENPIGDARGLLPPKLQEPPEQNFRFDVHASPGYLSAQPITRQASPGIRTANGGITHARNTPFTAASYQVANAFPNPGLPIIPLWGPHPHPIPYPPGVEHYASTNYWNTVAKGEYARFELRAKPQDSTEKGPAEYTYTDDLNGGPEKYVRLAQDVTIDIDGTPRNVGRVEPIDVSAMGHYPFIQQGYFGYEEGNWGLGDYLIPGGYGPAECTPAFPNVGPDIPPAQLMTGPQCLDFFKPGAIGGILMSGPLRMLGGSGKVIFASQDNANLPAQYNKEAARLCKREREGPTAKSPREDEADCPDILYRDRFD